MWLFLLGGSSNICSMCYHLRVVKEGTNTAVVFKHKVILGASNFSFYIWLYPNLKVRIVVEHIRLISKIYRLDSIKIITGMKWKVPIIRIISNYLSNLFVCWNNKGCSASLGDSTSNNDPTKRCKPLFNASNYVSQLYMNVMLTNKL